MEYHRPIAAHAPPAGAATISDPDLIAQLAQFPGPAESSLDVIAATFIRSALLAGRRPGTVKMYRWALDKLFTFLRAEGVDDLTKVTRDHLERWQFQMLQDGQMRPSSRSNASSTTKALIRWAAERDIVDWRLERAVVSVRVRKRKRRPIPHEDLVRILAYIVPRRPHMTLVELRDRALFVYLLFTGSRVDAALQVLKTDYIAPVVITKGGDEHTLTTGPTALDLVQDYLRARRDDSPWLWIKHGNNLNATGDRLESSGVREAWTRLCIQLQIKRFTTHQLRHTLATTAANAGASPFALKERLHHVKLETTMGYVEVGEPLQRQITDTIETLIKSSAPPRALPRAPRRRWSDYR